MKATYIKPQITVVELQTESTILAISDVVQPKDQLHDEGKEQLTNEEGWDKAPWEE